MGNHDSETWPQQHQPRLRPGPVWRVHRGCRWPSYERLLDLFCAARPRQDPDGEPGIQQGPTTDALHPIQRAFWMQGGFQCGICTRGFVMSTYALLTANPNPTKAEIVEGLSGNICRCGAYPKMFASVEAAANEMANPPAKPTVVLGPPPPRTGSASTLTFTFVNPFGIGRVHRRGLGRDAVAGRC